MTLICNEMSLLQTLLTKAWAGELITEELLRKLCSMVHVLLVEEPNVVPLKASVVILGDINGRFHELRKVVESMGPVASTQYLFLGGYVNKGYFSLETFTLLMALKANWPDQITILRGNHECRSVTSVFGFYDECMKKYGHSRVWKLFCDMFDFLPIAATLDCQIICVHGGISPCIKSIDHISIIERNVEVPHVGRFCDLLWSDPEECVEDWRCSPRGAGWLYGERPLKKFLHLNKLTLFCRGHQLVMEGYKYMFDDKLVTVYSSPNHCYRVGNPGAVMTVSSSHEKSFFLFDDVKENEIDNTNGPLFA